MCIWIESYRNCTGYDKIKERRGNYWMEVLKGHIQASG